MPIIPVGADFIVNTAAAGNQSAPSVTALSNGRFVVTWTSGDPGDGSGTCVRGGLFGSDGNPLGNDFILNTTTAGNQNRTSVAALANGSFMATWDSADGGDGSGTCVRGRLFDANGTPLGNDFILDSTTPGNQSFTSVTGLMNGGFVVTWRSVDGIRARLFDQNGAALANDFFVTNDKIKSIGFGSSVAALEDGGFVVTWNIDAENVGGIRARTFNADGTDTSNNNLLLDPIVRETPWYGTDRVAGGWTSQNQFPRTFADVNGDDRADVIGFGDNGVFISFANANGTFQTPAMKMNAFGASAADGGWVSDDQYPRTGADVNGDGRADLIGFGDDGVWVALANANGTFHAPSLKLNSLGASALGGGWVSNDKYPRLAGDVNRDGRADLVGFGDDGVWVALANPDGSFQAPSLNLPHFGVSAAAGGWSSNDQFPRVLADVNQDGMADIVGFGIAGVYVALATGGGSFAMPYLAHESFGTSAAAGGWSSNDKYPRLAADVDGNGSADLVGFGDAGVYVALARSDGTFNPVMFVLNSFGAGASASGWISNNLFPRALADTTGDGSADILGFGTDGIYASHTQTGTYLSVSAPGQGATAVTGLPDGRYVVTWWNGTELSGHIYGQLYDASNHPIRARFDIDTTRSPQNTMPHVMALADGRFMVTWNSGGSSGSGDGSGTAIHGRLFNADGSADGNDFVANTTTMGDQIGGAVATLPNGRIVVTYSSGDNGDSSGTNIRAQLFDATNTGATLANDGAADFVGVGEDHVCVSLSKGDGTFGPTAEIGSFGNGTSAGGWSSNNPFPRVLGDIDGARTADIIGFGDSGVYVSQASDFLLI